MSAAVCVVAKPADRQTGRERGNPPATVVYLFARRPASQAIGSRSQARPLRRRQWQIITPIGADGTARFSCTRSAAAAATSNTANGAQWFLNNLLATLLIVS